MLTHVYEHHACYTNIGSTTEGWKVVIEIDGGTCRLTAGYMGTTCSVDDPQDIQFRIACRVLLVSDVQAIVQKCEEGLGHSLHDLQTQESRNSGHIRAMFGWNVAVVLAASLFIVTHS